MFNNKVYHRIDALSGSVATLRAEGVKYYEIAEIEKLPMEERQARNRIYDCYGADGIPAGRKQKGKSDEKHPN